MKRLLLALAFCSSLSAVFAQTPTLPLLISYHGRVADSTGVLIGNLAPTNREVHFKIYNHKTDSAAGNRLYTEKQTVTIANGEFSVLIGSGTVPAVTGQANLVGSLEAAFNPTSGTGLIDRYLGISVADANGVMGTEIAPRQQIVTAAFALRAKVSESVSPGAITNAMIAAGTIAGDRIATNTITGTQIAATTITGANIATNTITADKLAAGAGATTAYTSVVSITTGDTATLANYNEQLNLIWSAKPSMRLALATDSSAADGLFGQIAAHDAGIEWRPLKLNPHGGRVRVGDPTMDAGGGLDVYGPLTINTHAVGGAGSLTVGGGITAGVVTTGALDGSQIKNGTISSDKLNFTPGGGTPAANSVTSSIIADGTIANADIADGAITAAKFATSSFGYAKFPDGARVAIGLNVNHDGNAGTTSTIVANPADTIFTDMWDGTTSIFKVRKNGSVNVGSRSNTNAMFTVGDVAATVTIPLKVQSALSTYGDSTTDYSNASLSTPIVAGTAMTPTAVIRARSGDDALLFLQNSDGKAKFWFNANSTCFRGDGGVSFNTWSDARLKRDIRPLSGALDQLLQLRSVTFEYLHAPGKTETGFVAQEVEKVFPDWVQKGDDGILSLSIRGFESRTVQALRELRAEKDQQLQQRDVTIAALEKNVAAMKTEATETKAQLAALQQAVAALSARASN